MTQEQKARKAAKFKIWQAKNRERRNAYHKELTKKWTPEKRASVKVKQKGHYARLQVRKSLGKCTYSVNCEEPLIGKAKFCLLHWAIGIRYSDIRQVPEYSAEELVAVWISQQGKCAITGIPIIPGETAELDHILPVAKGGKSTIVNIRFVHAAINRMKWDRTDDEFAQLIIEMIPGLLAWAQK